ncbi:hypothetical protein R5R35_014674 [Gryllus longicercus]|uniref:Uncharacterized protein n=1 Tax=Gryllus longicercus TaxID=2509291 RepID=A0AAN9VEJ8_9ORTH
MEERLDDAINVLRNHAETPVGAAGGLGLHGLGSGAPPHSNGLLGAYPPTAGAGPGLDTHMPSPHPGTPGSTVGATQSTAGYPGLTGTPDTDGPIKIERLSGPTSSASKKRKDPPGSGPGDTKPGGSDLTLTGASGQASVNSSSVQKGSKRSRR